MQLQDLFGFNRAISDRLAPRLARTSLTPNHITSMSMVCGVLAGGLFAQPGRGPMLAAAAMLQLSFILDNCDGTVARLKNMRSRFGMWYDYTADVVVELSLWVGLACGSVGRGIPGTVVWPWAAAAAAGSVFNFFRVILDEKKRQATGPMVPVERGGFIKALDRLSHDGDPTVLIWIVALWADPFQFLMLGAVYIHLLWTGALILKCI